MKLWKVKHDDSHREMVRTQIQKEEEACGCALPTIVTMTTGDQPLDADDEGEQGENAEDERRFAPSSSPTAVPLAALLSVSPNRQRDKQSKKNRRKSFKKTEPQQRKQCSALLSTNQATEQDKWVLSLLHFIRDVALAHHYPQLDALQTLLRLSEQEAVGCSTYNTEQLLSALKYFFGEETYQDHFPNMVSTCNVLVHVWNLLQKEYEDEENVTQPEDDKEAEAEKEEEEATQEEENAVFLLKSTIEVWKDIYHQQTQQLLMQMEPFQGLLPVELFFHASSLLRCSHVCRHWRDLLDAGNNTFWRMAYATMYGEDDDIQDSDEEETPDIQSIPAFGYGGMNYEKWLDLYDKAVRQHLLRKRMERRPTIYNVCWKEELLKKALGVSLSEFERQPLNPPPKFGRPYDKRRDQPSWWKRYKRKMRERRDRGLHRSPALIEARIEEEEANSRPCD
ncbi:hypothetical protein QOT17_011563 [Balamuthia mandrillaris]